MVNPEIAPNENAKEFDLRIRRAKALAQIVAERDRAESAHGYDLEHDQQHSAGDFATYIDTYVARLKTQLSAHDDPKTILQNAESTMCKIGGLVLAYLQSRD